jgi:hypothetical protein
MVKVLIYALFAPLFSWVGGKIENSPLIGKIGGRVYFNLNTFAGGLKLIPFSGKLNLTRIFGGAQGNIGDLAHLSIPEEDIPKLTASIFKMLCQYL